MLDVAAGAQVSIGTVQHYFPTKDRMLAAAYEEVIRRIRSRLQAVKLGGDIRRNLSAVLAELLPLDQRRVVESRVHLAFAARAATTPELARTQRVALAELHNAVTQAFATAWGDRASRATCALAAHAAIAAADGLALHAVSSGGWLPGRRQTATLELALDALISIHDRESFSPHPRKPAANQEMTGRERPNPSPGLLDQDGNRRGGSQRPGSPSER